MPVTKQFRGSRWKMVGKGTTRISSHVNRGQRLTFRFNFSGWTRELGSIVVSSDFSRVTSALLAGILSSSYSTDSWRKLNNKLFIAFPPNIRFTLGLPFRFHGNFISKQPKLALESFLLRSVTPRSKCPKFNKIIRSSRPFTRFHFYRYRHSIALFRAGYCSRLNIWPSCLQ